MPQCPLSLKNYAVRYTQGGGKSWEDPDGPIFRMDKPYQSRAVDLESIDPAFWNDDGLFESYYDRQLLKGVYHQFGGRQLKENRRPCGACLICGGAIQFFGCIDSDDLNVPIYENRDPRALVIGDMQTLNLFACEECAAVNYCMSV